jgi:hypothetical protein
MLILIETQGGIKREQCWRDGLIKTRKRRPWDRQNILTDLIKIDPEISGLNNYVDLFAFDFQAASNMKNSGGTQVV